MRVLKHFSKKKFTSFHLSLHILLIFSFIFLSSLSSYLFSCSLYLSSLFSSHDLLFSFIFSLLLSCLSSSSLHSFLFFSRHSSFIFSCIFVLSRLLCLSLSPCDVVVVLCGVCRCGRGVVVVVVCVWFVPCMPAHAHMCFNVCAWCRYTRGRFERTHGDVLNPHTGGGRGSSSFLLTEICPRTVITCFRG